VCQSHANQKGNNGQHHDPIFRKHLLSTNITPDNTNEYDGNSIQSCPPASEKSRLGVSKRLEIWRFIDKAPKEIHRGWRCTSQVKFEDGEERSRDELATTTWWSSFVVRTVHTEVRSRSLQVAREVKTVNVSQADTVAQE
jgi:hypothetical protein